MGLVQRLGINSVPNCIRYTKQARVTQIMIFSSRQKRRKHVKLKNQPFNNQFVLNHSSPFIISDMFNSPKLPKTVLASTNTLGELVTNLAAVRFEMLVGIWIL